MTRHAVARRYAQALFDVALKQGSIDAVAHDLEQFAALITSHDDLRRTFESPAIPVLRKQAMLEALVSKGTVATSDVRRLLLLLGERDRVSFIGEISAAFAARVRQHAHVVEAEFVSAVPLGEARQAALATALGKATGGTVTVTTRVDPSIIGGVIANVGNLVFDGSVLSQLDRFKQKLLAQA
jgi:F-type H+-transporting ATPase subunit delta